MLRLVIVLLIGLTSSQGFAQLFDQLPELKWGVKKLAGDRVLLEWNLSIRPDTYVIYPVEGSSIYFERIQLRDSINFRLVGPITETPLSTVELVPEIGEPFHVARGDVGYSVIIERMNKSTTLLEGDFWIAIYTADYMKFYPDARFVVVWE